MEDSKRVEIIKGVLTYLALYNGNKTKAEMVEDIKVLAKDEEEMDLLKFMLELELSCSQKYSINENGEVIKKESKTPECCALCDRADIIYNEFGDGDLFDMMSANIVCKDLNSIVEENILSDDMYITSPKAICPRLKK